MKKIYTTLCVAILASSSLFAQKQVAGVDRFDIADFNFAERTPTDTLLPGDFFSGTPSLYTSAQGYVVGNNQYGDEVKAQVFILSDATILEEALFFFGAKDDGGNGSNVAAVAFNMDGTTGTTSAGTGQQSPGTLLGSANMALSDIDTSGGFTVATFASPIYVSGDFALGFDVTSLTAGDTVGLITSQDGDGGGAELTWERWSNNGGWYTMIASWPLDFDFGILAVVDNSSNGIETDSYFNGIKADVIPNPAVDVANIVFDLEKVAEVDIKIIDITGKIVYTADKGELNQGRHTINVPVSDLTAGTYYYTIGANGNRLTKKMVVTK
jgi:hypothetical protein